MPDRVGRLRRSPHGWVALLLAVSLAGCGQPTGPVDAHDLALAAGDIASIASEAALLTEQVGARSVTANFASIHQDSLTHASRDVASALARPAPPALRAQHDHLLQLRARLGAARDDSDVASHNVASLEQLHGRLLEIATQAQQGAKR